jgi:hypothetical protein
MRVQPIEAEGLKAMDAALRSVLRAVDGHRLDDGAPSGLTTAEIERRVAALLAPAFAALARPAEPLPACATGRAALYRRLAEAAGAALPEAEADALRIRLALDLCDLEAELARRSG